MSQWGRRVKRLISAGAEAPKADSLLASARGAGWEPDRPDRLFLTQLERRLRGRRPRTIAVLASPPESLLPETLAERYPESAVLVLGGRRAQEPSVDDRTTVADASSSSLVHAALSAYGPFDLLVDATPSAEAAQVGRLQEVFLHLRPRGVYAARSFRADGADDAGESLWGLVSRLVDGRASTTNDGHMFIAHDEVELGKAITSLTVDEHLLTLTNGATALPKLREAEVDTVLEVRRGFGTVLDKRPALHFTSRCVVRDNAERRDFRLVETYPVPSVTLREYHDVVCAPGQVAVEDGLLLPDTYRHHLYPRLENRRTRDRTRSFAEPTQDISEPLPLPGAYFYLDSEWPGHFGHVLTEQVSRLWAWPAAKRAHPDLKALLALPAKSTELTTFETAIFSAAGIPAEDIVTIDGPVRVETLLGATPMLSNPSYIHPDIGEVWARMRQALVAYAPQRDYPARIFCSRRLTYKRGCRNVDEVEAYFAEHGFSVVYAEDHSVAEQAAMVVHAEVVAGFAGSALFNLCYSPTPKRVIMICPESYTARNEYLISAVIGHEMDLVWCVPDVAQPGQGFDVKAFVSGFTFDFAREGRYLAEVIATLP